MSGEGIRAGLLPDGKRLHLRHGPIDLIIQAFGDAAEIHAAYAQAAAAFVDVLPTLAKELPLLRAPLACPSPPLAGEREGPTTKSWEGEVVLGTDAAVAHLTRLADARHPLPPKTGGEGYKTDGMPNAIGPVARRMIAACWPHREQFITPMAAVAGAVADHVLQALLDGRTLSHAYVNDGGDIAFYLAPGQSLTCGLVADLAAPAIDGTIALSHAMPVRGLATSGRASKGQGGRSFSLGIADAVTVLARDAASADAAATVIANAVDLPGHPAITRGPASEQDPDSDLGERLVTLDVGPLADSEIDQALRRGAMRAENLRASGLIHGAVLVLRRRLATVGAGLPRLAAA